MIFYGKNVILILGENMKEVVCRKILSQDKKRKFVSFRERLEQKGKKLEIYKNYFYRIKEEKDFLEQSEIEKFLYEIQQGKEANHLYIKKITDTASGKVALSYILKGNIFALVKNKLYRIIFKQEHILISYPI